MRRSPWEGCILLPLILLYAYLFVQQQGGLGGSSSSSSSSSSGSNAAFEDDCCNEDAASAMRVRQCPAYLSWIRKDLEQWRDAGGIRREEIEEGGQRANAAFRVIIKRNKLYAQHFNPCFQCRGTFTLWGLLMLLRRFPNRIPDLDLFFNCADEPAFNRSSSSNSSKMSSCSQEQQQQQLVQQQEQEQVKQQAAEVKQQQGVTVKTEEGVKKVKADPPLFGYATTAAHSDIPFPDWSFWGWPEINIGAWEDEAAAIRHASAQLNWARRRPVAHWKGNPHVAPLRQHLLRCNQTGIAELYAQDWASEVRQGFANSKLSEQCKHRYKVYAEGNSWSVSYKYIMACGSTVLDIDHVYHDFFTRALLPYLHFLPVKRSAGDMCGSLRDSVAWAESHPRHARAIAATAQEFVLRQLSMRHVYDYMYHLLREYSALLRFKPEVPPNATLLSPKKLIASLADDVQKQFLLRARIPQPAQPCSLD